MNVKAKNRTMNIMLLFMSSVFSLLAAEYICRTFQKSPLTGPIFEYESTLGYRNRPNAHTTQLVDGIRTVIRTNSQGFRMDREIEPRSDPNEVRILFLGDSFSFGTGVNVEDGIVARLEREAEATFPNKKMLFINAGVGGYGTQHELAFLELWQERIKPDAVVLIFGPNDVCDNIPLVVYRRNKNGVLILNHGNAPPITNTRLQKIANSIPIYEYLTQYSYFFNMLRGQIANGLAPVTPPTPASPREIAALAQEELGLTQELLLMLKKRIDQAGLPLLVASVGQIPSYDGTLKFIQAKPNWFVQNGFNFIDPTDEMKRLTTRRLQFINDGHYNAYGNEILAKALWPSVKNLISGIGRENATRK